MTPVTRPLLRYFGGKFQLRHWITSFIPEHKFYAEPFAGGASILLSKPPAPNGEILNDLNADVVNLFRVMQDQTQADELQRKLDWTPFAKAELELSREPTDDPVERARRMLIRSFMGIEVAGCCGTNSGFRMGNVDLNRYEHVATDRRTFRNCGKDWDNWRSALGAIRERLAGVMIYERDAIEFIKLMNSKDCLLYVDPPYHIETRSKQHGGTRYQVEFTAEQHATLIQTLLECKSMVLLSGYPHESYDLLEAAGWKREDKDYRANMSERRRTECLWISPNAQKNQLL